MNKILLDGRLTAEPQVNYSNNGNSVARFTVATDRAFKTDGQPTADFPSCVAFGKTAEFIEKYFKKGSGIVIEGRIQTGSYKNKDGATVYTTDIAVEKVGFPVGGAKKEGTETNNDDMSSFVNIPDGIDEELPFN